MWEFFNRFRPWIAGFWFSVALAGAVFFYLKHKPLPWPSDLDIFILGGQSNMSGRAKVSEWPEGVPRSDPRIWFVKDRTWRPAIEPIFYGGGVGPSMFFALSYLKTNPGVNVGLVPSAKAGSFLSQWSEGSDFFKSMVHDANRSKRYGTVKALLWFQGEAEAQTKATAERIAPETVAMFKAFRREVGDIPIIFAQIGSEPINRASVPYWKMVQQEQASISMPAVKMIKTDDLPNGGTLHLTVDGYRELGERFAAELRPVGRR